MFGNLTSGSQVYILDKRNVPTLSIGTVSNVVDGIPQIGTGYFGKKTVDLTVQVNGEQVKFEHLDTSFSISDNLSGTVISDNRDMMAQQVEAMQNQSRNILDSVDYHKQVLSACDEMLGRLNPKIAKEREQEKKISDLEGRIGGMEGKLDNIAVLLEKMTIKQ